MMKASKKFVLSLTMAMSIVSGSLIAEGKMIQFNQCLDTNPEGLDPHQNSGATGMVVSTIYDHLVKYDYDNRTIRNDLADNWSVSDDGLTYTIKLKKGIKWQSNSEFKPTRDLNADDVVFSFKRQITPNYELAGSQAHYPWVSMMDWKNLIKDIVAVDDLTVKFTLTRPEATFPLELGMPLGNIMSKEYAETMKKKGKLDYLSTHPIGTGMFSFVDYKQDSYVRLQKFKENWQAPNNIDRIVYLVSENNDVAMNKLEKGECDYVAGVPLVSLGQYLKKSDDPKSDVKIVEVHSIGLYSLYLNTKKAPFDNKLFRQAIMYAIDYDKIYNDAYNKRGKRANTAIPSVLLGYNADVALPQKDLAKAQELLKKSGVDANSVSLDFLVMPSNPPSYITAQIVQSNLKALGIKVNLLTYEWGKFLKSAYNDLSAHIVYSTWGADIPDPDNFVRQEFACSTVGENNGAGYCNPELDKILAEAVKVSDPKKRAELYKKAQTMLADDVVQIPLLEPLAYAAVNKKSVEKYPNIYGAPQLNLFFMKEDK